ncbi:hypothetical protein OJAV_G00073170 [Oryzias javanicus]|uniref:Uncharacterized protein n=1 Tax=Oryzias javanicus TaxID=123683 RepID=A0A3S2PAY7_ORYJA|nr:hypothetical protein OJAV_G00073170 [Oryzias javanicus]
MPIPRGGVRSVGAATVPSVRFSPRKTLTGRSRQPPRALVGGGSAVAPQARSSGWGPAVKACCSGAALPPGGSGAAERRTVKRMKSLEHRKENVRRSLGVWRKENPLCPGRFWFCIRRYREFPRDLFWIDGGVRFGIGFIQIK